MEWIKVSEATCTDIGISKFVCGVCEEAIDTEIISALGHKYKTNTISPTCEKDGSKEYICSVCNDQHTEILKAVGHLYEEYIVELEATCDQRGLVRNICANCDSELVIVVSPVDHADSDSDDLCDSCGTEYIATAFCKCICHEKVYGSIVYRLFNFIWRFFGINRICCCGKNHY